MLRQSITALCVADHGGDPAEIAAWCANKTPENTARWIRAPDLITLVAEGPAGFAAASRAGRLLLLYVAPDARFQGVSARLLSAVEAAWRAGGVAEATLESTQTAQRFYRARGWVEVAGGEGGVEMRKPL